MHRIRTVRPDIVGDNADHYCWDIQEWNRLFPFKKISIFQDNYKLGKSINGVATHECFKATRSEITNVKAAITINYVESTAIMNYDVVVRNKVGDDDV